MGRAAGRAEMKNGKLKVENGAARFRPVASGGYRRAFGRGEHPSAGGGCGLPAHRAGQVFIFNFPLSICIRASAAGGCGPKPSKPSASSLCRLAPLATAPAGKGNLCAKGRLEKPAARSHPGRRPATRACSCKPSLAAARKERHDRRSPPSTKREAAAGPLFSSLFRPAAARRGACAVSTARARWGNRPPSRRRCSAPRRRSSPCAGRHSGAGSGARSPC